MRTGELDPWWYAGTLLVRPLFGLVFRLRVRGLEHVPTSGGAILAFNHVSALDGPALAVIVAARVRRPVRFLVASGLFGRRAIGWILRRFDQIPIRRGAGDTDALERAVEAVRGGGLVAIAPEGRVNDDGAPALQRIRRGAARIASRTRAPLVPVGIWGTQSRWPRSGPRWGRPWRPRLAVVVGPPLLATGGQDEASIEDLTARLAEHLDQLVARARTLAGG